MAINVFNFSALILAAYLSVFAEAVMDAPRNWLGAQIDLLPGLMVYLGLMWEFPFMLTIAVAAGLLFDSLSANPFGITIIPLLLVGVMTHRYRDLILREQRFAQIVIGSGASLAAPLLTVLLLEGFGQQPLVGWRSILPWLVMGLGGGLFTPVWFLLFGKLDRALRYPEDSDSSFRADREIERGRT